MAVITRNTLVLNSVCVVRGVVTGTVGMGFEAASGTTVAIPFSMRHASHPYSLTGQATSLRQDHADRCGAVSAADRAGRSECLGVLASPSPAWSLARGGICPTAAWRFGRFTAKHPASVDNALPGDLLASRVEALRNGQPSRLARATWARRHAEAGLTGRKPVSGVLPTSARGCGF
jgi:hypothetical protein